MPERLRKNVEAAVSEGNKVKIIAGKRFGPVVVYGIKKIDKEKQMKLTGEEGMSRYEHRMRRS